MPARGGFAAQQRERRLAKTEGPQDDLILSETLDEELAIVRRGDAGDMSFLDWSMRCPEPKTGTLDFDRFPFQRKMYEEGATDREEVIVKSTQVGMCLDEETPVLAADLRWIRIADAEPGAALVAVDDGTSKRHRRLRRAVVEAKWTVRAEAFRLVFDDGREVVATAEHRFLWKRSGRLEWREVGRMAVGDTIRDVVAPWGEATYEDGWMAGFLDGEGSLRSAAKRAVGTELVLTQQPNDAFRRALDYLRERGYVFGQTLEPRPNGRPVARAVLSQLRDILRLVGQTNPSRFPAGWWNGLKLPSSGDSWRTLVAVEPLGERDMVDIQTSRSTFVAAGLVSHNSARNARKGLYFADQRGLTTLYVFPTKGDVYDFSDARITPMVERSEYLRSRVRTDTVFNKGLKKIGLGFFYLRGSEKKTALDSVDADCLILDEYDTLRRENIPDAERRISGSESGSITRLGVPTFRNSGVWAHYEKTDKRRWLVQCGACNRWQELDFFQNVDFSRAVRICSHCGRDLDVRKGDWVAEHPDRAVKGWHVPRLIVPSCDVRSLIDASQQKEPHLIQVFFNKDLGLPYLGGENRLTEEMLRACWRDFTMEVGYAGANPVTMGVDVASVRALNVRISEHLADGFKRALWIGTVESFDELVPLMDRFRVNMAAVDRAPERRLAEAFANLFAGRVFLVGYATNQKNPFAVDEEMRMASVRPLETFDATLERVRSQKNLLPLDWPAGYVEHMQSPVRTAPVKNAIGVEEVEYVFTGPADYFHAEVYDTVAELLWWLRQHVEEQQRTHLWNLEDQLEGFSRSDLAGAGAAWEEQEYRAGPGDGEYRGGPGY